MDDFEQSGLVRPQSGGQREVPGPVGIEDRVVRGEDGAIMIEAGLVLVDDGPIGIEDGNVRLEA